MPKAETAVLDSPATAPQRKFVSAWGRGRVGKSFLLDWMIGRARSMGREVAIADFDRNNSTLAERYSTAQRAVSAEDEDMSEAITAALNRLAEGGPSLVMDTGGGDRLVSEYSRDVPMVDFCASVGIRPVLVVCLGPDDADLKHVQSIADSGAQLPADTIWAINTGLLARGRAADRAFGPLLDSAAFRTLAGEAPSLVMVPALVMGSAAQVYATGLTFQAARDGLAGRDGAKLDPLRRAVLARWLDDMEEAFAPVVEALP